MLCFSVQGVFFTQIHRWYSSYIFTPRIGLFTVYDAILAGAQTLLELQWMYGILSLATAITPLQRGGFPQRKCILKEICTEIIFMKYKEEIQVIVNDRKRIFKISYKPF